VPSFIWAHYVSTGQILRVSVNNSTAYDRYCLIDGFVKGSLMIIWSDSQHLVVLQSYFVCKIRLSQQLSNLSFLFNVISRWFLLQYQFSWIGVSDSNCGIIFHFHINGLDGRPPMVENQWYWLIRWLVLMCNSWKVQNCR
jgi:hypothetical protein